MGTTDSASTEEMELFANPHLGSLQAAFLRSLSNNSTFLSWIVNLRQNGSQSLRGGGNLTSKIHFPSGHKFFSHKISTSLLPHKNKCNYNLNNRQFCFLLLNDLCFDMGHKRHPLKGMKNFFI